MKQIAIVATALSFFITSAHAQDKASQKSLTQAIEGNFAEVQMGELAQKNGQSSEVKSYGRMLATDHNAANQKAMEAQLAARSARAALFALRPHKVPTDWTSC